MTPALTEAVDRADPDHHAGMIDYAARTAIRDLIRLHGYEEARDKIAGYLNDEADRKPRKLS